MPGPDTLPPASRVRQPAFLWTFGTSVALTAGLLAFSASLLPCYSPLVFLFAIPVVWGAAFAVGVVVWLAGRRRAGRAMMLGALAAAAVGCLMCGGTFYQMDRSAVDPSEALAVCGGGS